MPRVAKKKKAIKVKKTTVKKKPVAKKKVQPKVANEKGAYSFQWGSQAKLTWFKALAKRYGMAGTNLIKLAVEEYVENHNKDD